MCCRLCGSEESVSIPNRPWWDCDDGWRFGALCKWCYQTIKDQKPQENDFAYDKRNAFDSDVYISERDD